MNCLRYVFVVAVLAFALSKGNLPTQKTCCLRGKTRFKLVCKGKMLALSGDLARVAEVQPGNFVCELHRNQLRARNNVCSCPLPSHSVTMSNTPIPERLYGVFDQVGRNMPSYRPGTRWCTSCRRNADRKFLSLAEYQSPAKRKTVGIGNIKMFPTNNIFPNRMQKGKKKVKFVENSNVLPLVERNVSE